MKRFIYISAAAALTMGLVLSAAGPGSPSARGSASISNQGTPVALSLQGKRVLARVNRDGARVLKQAYLLGERGGSNLYRLAGPTDSCFGIGPAAAKDGPTLSLITCDSAFASGAKPILVMAVVEASRTMPQLHYVFARGVADDSVARVAIVSDLGETVGESRVVNNIFSVPTLGNATGTTFVGVGNGRKVVYSQHLPPP